MSRLTHLPFRILKVHIEALTGLSTYTNQMVLTTHCSLKVVMSPWNGSCCGKGGQSIQYKDSRGGWGASDCLDSACGSKCSQILSLTSSNKPLLLSPLTILPAREERCSTMLRKHLLFLVANTFYKVLNFAKYLVWIFR